MTKNTIENRYAQSFVGPLNEKQEIIKSVQFSLEVKKISNIFYEALLDIVREKRPDCISVSPQTPILIIDEIIYGNKVLDEEIQKYKDEFKEFFDAPVNSYIESNYLGCPSAFPFHINDRRSENKYKDRGDDVIENIIQRIIGDLELNNILEEIGNNEEKNYREKALQLNEKTIKVLGQYIYTEVVRKFVSEDENFDIETIYFGDEIYSIIDRAIQLNQLDDSIKVENIRDFIESNNILVGLVTEEIFIYIQEKLERYKLQRNAGVQAGKSFNRLMNGGDIFKCVDREVLLKKLSQNLLITYPLEEIEGQLDYFEFIYKDDLKIIEGELKTLKNIEKNEDNILELSKKRDRLEKLYFNLGNDYIQKYSESYNKSFEDLLSEYAAINGATTDSSLLSAKEGIIFNFYLSLEGDNKPSSKLNFVNSGSVGNKTKEFIHGNTNDLPVEGIIMINSLKRNGMISKPLFQINQKFKYFLFQNPNIQKVLEESENIEKDIKVIFPFLKNIK